MPVAVLDGDLVRAAHGHDLGFSAADRDRNVRRLTALADQASVTGRTVVVAAVSPFRAARQEARRQLGERFVEVYVQASLEECIRRDPKGLYARALRGQIEDFTGISSPYEAPLEPDVVLDTERQGRGACAQLVLERLLPISNRC